MRRVLLLNIGLLGAGCCSFFTLTALSPAAAQETQPGQELSPNDSSRSSDAGAPSSNMASPPPRPGGSAQESEQMAPVPSSPLEKGVLLQVFLDKAGFGPGKIDGKGGEFTRKAIVEYEKAHGLKLDGRAESLPLSEAGTAFTQYTVTPQDEHRIGPAPKDPREEAHQKWLPYTSVLELVSEKFHTTQPFLLELNPKYRKRPLKAGDRLKVPNVQAFDIAAAEARRTEEEAHEAKERQAGPWVDIDVVQKELEVKEGDRIVAAFPITPGSTTLPAPKGHWHVLTITYMPKFRYDKEMLFHGRRGSGGIVTPPGPNSKVGVVWMSLNKKGVGIHGTDEPETIGRTTSHGCIRLANWDVVRLASLIQPGARVIIH